MRPTEQVVLDHLAMVRQVAYRTCPHARRQELEDLWGDGNLGLVKAAATWRGDVPFGLHARGRIRAEIIDGLRRRNHTRCKAPILWQSLDAMTMHDGEIDNRHIPTTGDEIPINCDDLQDRMLAVLDNSERLVVGLYYWPGDITFAEIAVLLGVTKSRVSQIHSRALDRLRDSYDEGAHMHDQATANDAP